MKHVFLDDDYAQGHFIMLDIEKRDDCDIMYSDRIHNNRFLNRLYCHFLYGKPRNRYVNPERKLLWRMIFYNKISSDTQTVAITTFWYNKRFLQILKELYPHVKLVLILRDTVLSNIKRNDQFNIEEAKRIFDMILSYDDVYDVPTYGLKYAPVFVSKIDELLNHSLKCKYDIAFIAKAKDRLEVVHDLYKIFNANKIKCFFYITQTKESERLVDSGIIYLDKHLNRYDMLQKELESNCILEVLKGDAYSNTLRFWEAIMYNKKLYTNWKGVYNSPYYDPRFIRVFNDVDTIDCDFIKERIDVNYHYNGELSPVKMLDLFKQLTI